MRRFLFTVLASCAMSATTAAAQSLAGEWDASYNTPGGVRSFKIVFQVDGDRLTGTVKRQAGDVPLMGTVKGDTVNFSYTIVYNENALVLTVAAMLKGDSLTGVVDFGGAAQEEFSATRVPRAPPEAAGGGPGARLRLPPPSQDGGPGSRSPSWTVRSASPARG